MARLLQVSVALALLLASSGVSADMIGPGHKPAKGSIQVSANLPEDRAVLLGNTFEGATRITPGAPVQISWHPLHGKLELVLADTSQLEALKSLPSGEGRLEKLHKLTTPCAEPFEGVRTVKISEPYDEVRWYYDVKLDGDKCTGTLTRTAYLSDGKEISTDAAAPVATPSASAVPQGSASPKTPSKPAASSGCGACTVGRSRPGALWMLLPLLGLVRRRARERRARSGRRLTTRPAGA